jgi:hypothetical protein
MHRWGNEVECTAGVLDTRMQEVAQVLWEEAVKCLPVKKHGRRMGRVTKEAARLRKMARYLRALSSHLDDLVCGRITRGDKALLQAVRNLPRAGIPVPDVTRFTFEQWQDWGAVVVETLHTVTTKLARVNAHDPERMRRLSSRLWRKGKGNRDFFRRLLRGQSSARLDSAHDPSTGRRTWDPSRYRPIIKETVGRIFSDRVELPDAAARTGARCTGLCGGSGSVKDMSPSECQDVRCMGGLPSWWWDYYGAAHVSKVGTEVFRDIMRPASLQTIVDTIGGVPAGKAPGGDGISIAMLRILCDPEFVGCPAIDAPIVKALRRLTNDSLKLGYVPKHAKDGVISMIPKGARRG